ncbi:hypothetical protein T484DRAFT_1906229 [Baffinella frigidus]|nr:hypothetical protein T484DRAFT_1906229 [Cryptophyta sp. CCMP2293]
MLAPRAATLARRNLMLPTEHMRTGGKFLAGAGVSFGLGLTLPSLLSTTTGAAAGAGLLLLAAGAVAVKRNEAAAAIARRSLPAKALARQVYKLTTSESPVGNLPFVHSTAWAMREAINGKRWLRDDVDALRPRLALLLQQQRANAVALQASRDLEWDDAGALPDGDLRLRLGAAEYMAEHSGDGNRWVEARFQVCCEGADGRLHTICTGDAARRAPAMEEGGAAAGEAFARSVADAEASSGEDGRKEGDETVTWRVSSAAESA